MANNEYKYSCYATTKAKYVIFLFIKNPFMLIFFHFFSKADTETEKERAALSLSTFFSPSCSFFISLPKFLWKLASLERGHLSTNSSCQEFHLTPCQIIIDSKNSLS